MPLINSFKSSKPIISKKILFVKSRIKKNLNGKTALQGCWIKSLAGFI